MDGLRRVRHWCSGMLKSLVGISPVSSTDTRSLFFFSSRRRHTRCGRDWSSDVCSSDLITIGHIELMNIVIIITGSIVGIAYITELFVAWYSGVPGEQYAFLNRISGPYAWAYWIMMTCNVISPQVFWIKKIRTSIVATFILSIVVNIGMWFERFVIIVTSLHRDYLPSSWAMFYPTIYDVGLYLFTFGLFFTLFLLFAKFFPVINMSEIKAILKSSSEKTIK